MSKDKSCKCGRLHVDYSGDKCPECGEPFITKAKLTIEPGCEAGSLYCGECEFLIGHSYDFDQHCEIFDWDFPLDFQDMHERCKACLDAEVPQVNSPSMYPGSATWTINQPAPKPEES